MGTTWKRADGYSELDFQREKLRDIRLILEHFRDVERETGVMFDSTVNHLIHDMMEVIDREPVRGIRKTPGKGKDPGRREFY